MNNFEKRMFLDYLEALAGYLDLETYDFDDTLPFSYQKKYI